MTNALSRLGQQRLARAVQVVDQAVRDGELGGQTSQVVLGVLQRAVEAADLEEVAPLRDRKQEAAVEEGAVQAVLAELLGERQQRLHEARLPQALLIGRASCGGQGCQYG